MKDINLFCFPFLPEAINTHTVSMRKTLPAFMQVVFFFFFFFLHVEYPGRGARMKDAFITDMEALVNDLYQEIEI